MLRIKFPLIVLVLTTLASAANVWQRVPTPSGATHIHDFTIIPSNNHWFIADRFSGFWRSPDQGTTWAQITNSGIPACGGWNITWDSAHSQLIAAASGSVCGGSAVNTYWRSSNEGATWTQIILPPELAPTAVAPAYSGPAIGPSGIIVDGGFWPPNNFGCGTFYSTDGGVTTHNISYTLLPNSQGQGCGSGFSYSYNPITADFWLGTETFGVLRSTDGINWTQVSPPNCESGFPPPCLHNDGNIQSTNYDSSGNELMGGQAGIFRSSGSGGSYTWTLIRASTGGDIRTIYRDPNGNLYYGYVRGTGDTNAVYRSVDQGATWQPWNSGIPPNSQGNNLEAWHFITNTTDGKLYTVVIDGSAGDTGYVYVTVNPIVNTSQLQPPTNLQSNVQ